MRTISRPASLYPSGHRAPRPKLRATRGPPPAPATSCRPPGSLFVIPLIVIKSSRHGPAPWPGRMPRKHLLWRAAVLFTEPCSGCAPSLTRGDAPQPAHPSPRGRQDGSSAAKRRERGAHRTAAAAPAPGTPPPARSTPPGVQSPLPRAGGIPHPQEFAPRPNFSQPIRPADRRERQGPGNAPLSARARQARVARICRLTEGTGPTHGACHREELGFFRPPVASPASPRQSQGEKQPFPKHKQHVAPSGSDRFSTSLCSNPRCRNAHFIEQEAPANS